MNVNSIYYGGGSRKEAYARVYLVEGTGNISLFTGNTKNRRERDLREYFCNDFLIEKFLYPLMFIGKRNDFDVRIYVRGGGISAQSDAIRLGIAKALLKNDPSIKSTLKTYRLLTQDRRFKERKKVGKRGARRSPQFTKR